jgi:hypothetical protein
MAPAERGPTEDRGLRDRRRKLAEVATGPDVLDIVVVF